MGHRNATRAEGPDPVYSDTTCAGHGLCRYKHGLECVVAKGLGSPYAPGRTRWLKIKNRMNCIGCNSS